MKRKVKGRVHCKFIGISSVLVLACTWPTASADLVPVSVLLAYAPDKTYEHEVELENRRHNLALLNFRDQTRAAEAKFSKAMLDCANTPPEDNCAKKAAAARISATKTIQKREIDENTLHLGNLDKIATTYAFGKH